MKHRVSVERLSHFSCGHCGKWWSIGDWLQDRELVACPWCGIAAPVETVTDVVREEVPA